MICLFVKKLKKQCGVVVMIKPRVLMDLLLVFSKNTGRLSKMIWRDLSGVFKIGKVFLDDVKLSL